MAYGESGRDAIFGFMPGKETVDAMFILTRLQEEYLGKEKKLYMCFVDLEGIRQGAEDDIGVSNGEEMYTRGNGESSDEFI